MNKHNLFQENLNIAHKLAHKFKIWKEYEDVLQEALIGLWEATSEYDPKKARFSTFAYRVIKNRLYSFCHAGKRQVVTIKLKEDDIILPNNIENLLMKRVTKNIQDLSGRDRNVLLKKAQGYSWKDLAQEHGCTYQNIQRIHKETIEGLK